MRWSRTLHPILMARYSPNPDRNARADGLSVREATFVE
jgi:hypothetical protein